MWTFAAAFSDSTSGHSTCACTNIANTGMDLQPPSYVGDDYYFFAIAAMKLIRVVVDSYPHSLTMTLYGMVKTVMVRAPVVNSIILLGSAKHSLFPSQ